jgi:hypothetical protein
MATKEDESRTGSVWVAAFHHFTSPFSLGTWFETYEPFLQFSNFFAGLGLWQITETADNEYADTGARLYAKSMKILVLRPIHMSTDSTTHH